MRVDVTRSGDAIPVDGQLLSTYVINERLAIDAGVLGTMVAATLQNSVSDVFLSHCHMDHVASLPFFLEQRDLTAHAAPTIHAHPFCNAALHKHFFNDTIWPDFERIEREEGLHFCRFNDLVPNETVSCNAIQITPISLSHTVPTFGFVVRDSSTAVAFVSDTEYDRTWVETLNGIPDLSAVFLECTFPNRLQWLAEKSKHMTPRDTVRFVRQWTGALPRIIINHSKPHVLVEVCEELEMSLSGTFEMVRTGQHYHFTGVPDQEDA